MNDGALLMGIMRDLPRLPQSSREPRFALSLISLTMLRQIFFIKIYASKGAISDRYHLVLVNYKQ